MGKDAVVPSFELAYYGGLFLSAADQGAAQPPGKGAAGQGGGVVFAPVAGDDVEFVDAAVSEIEAALPDLGQAMGAPQVPARRCARSRSG